MKKTRSLMVKPFLFILLDQPFLEIGGTQRAYNPFRLTIKWSPQLLRRILHVKVRILYIVDIASQLDIKILGVRSALQSNT